MTTKFDEDIDEDAVRVWMTAAIGDYLDRRTGEINMTAMAEGAADDLDLYKDRDSYGIPERVFEIALKVAEKAGGLK